MSPARGAGKGLSDLSRFGTLAEYNRKRRFDVTPEPRGRRRVKLDPLTVVEDPYVEAAKFQASATGIEPMDPVGRRAIAVLFGKLLIPDLLFTTGASCSRGPSPRDRRSIPPCAGSP